MSTVSQEEAQVLLGQPLLCADCNDWVLLPARTRKLVVRGGLTDWQGRRMRLTVELQARVLPGAGGMTYIFSVFNSTGYDIERVYQLEVNQGPRRKTNEHRRSHEHYGDARTMGAEVWSTWSYDELLRYFSTRTNIVFNPPPPDPRRFFRRKR